MSANIVAKFDNNIQLILTKFHEILDLISIQDKSLQVHSTESLQIQSNTQTIVRLVKELLSLTRTLKEKWVLGQVDDSVDSEAGVEERNNYDLYVKINKLLSNICE